MSENVDGVVPAIAALAADVMEVESVMVGGQAAAFRSRPDGQKPRTDLMTALVLGDAAVPPETVRVRGRLIVPSDQAYTHLAERLRPLGRTPILRKDKDGDGEVLLAVPGDLRQARQRVGVALTLFVLTVLSCLFVGAQMPEWVALSGRTNFNLLDGWPYTVSLLSILLCHEFGHYLVARRLGTPVSLPYFLPLPIGLGTMGAFINMTAPPRNRRHLLAIGAAGPLAGLLVAIPVLWVGLGLSTVQPLPAGGSYMLEGNSLLYAALKFLHFGRLLPSNGFDVFIHPVAYAGWAGLLVTALNLIPAGQLDGGHILDALTGARGSRIMLWVVLGALALLSFLWIGWLLWVVLVFVFGRLRIPPLDDVTPLTRRQRALALVMLVIFALVFTPIPMSIVG